MVGMLLQHQVHMDPGMATIVVVLVHVDDDDDDDDAVVFVVKVVRVKDVAMLMTAMYHRTQ